MSVRAASSTEQAARITCLLVTAICLVSLVAYLLVVCTGVDPGSRHAMPAWRAAIFAPASILFMMIGLIMLGCHLVFVTLAAAMACLIVSTAKAKTGKWGSLTTGLALIAVAGHVAFLLYPHHQG